MSQPEKVPVPEIVKHCALAIYLDGGLRGSSQKRFESAMNIARAQLTKYGYLSRGSELGDISRIRLSGKGNLREAQHRREGGAGVRKSRTFDELYDRFGPEAESEPTKSREAEKSAEKTSGEKAAHTASQKRAFDREKAQVDRLAKKIR